MPACDVDDRCFSKPAYYLWGAVLALALVIRGTVIQSAPKAKLRPPDARERDDRDPARGLLTLDAEVLILGTLAHPAQPVACHIHS